MFGNHSVYLLNDRLGNFTILGFLCFLLKRTPVVGIIIRGCNVEILQHEVTRRIGQAGTKCLRSVALLSDQRPRDDDAVGRIVVIDPVPFHVCLDKDFVYLFFENLAILGGFCFRVAIRMNLSASMNNVRNEGNTIFLHQASDFCQDQIFGDIPIAVASLILLKNLNGLSDLGELLIDIHLFSMLCHMYSFTQQQAMT